MNVKTMENQIMNRTLNVLLGAVAVALIGAGAASAQTGSLQGRRLILNDGGLTPATYNRITLTTPADATLTADYGLVMPPNDGNADDIIYTPDGTGTLQFTDGNGLFWRLRGNNTAFVDGTNNLLGTLGGTTAPLNIITDGVMRIRITATGNVGVGTNTTPSGLFSVGTGNGQLTIDASGNVVTAGNITINGALVNAIGVAATTNNILGTTNVDGITTINDGVSAFTTNIGTGGNTGLVTIGSTTNAVSILGATNTITGTTAINTTGNASTTIGSIANTGNVIVRANNDITIDVAATTNDLLLNNILDTPPTPIDDVLWITDAGNAVRRTSFSGLANQGIMFEGNEFRLGHSTDGSNPVITDRYVRIQGAGALTFDYGTAATSTMLSMSNTGNVGISVTGGGSTTIGSAAAGPISSQSATTVNSTAGTSMTNTTTTFLTNIVGSNLTNTVTTNALTTAGGTITQTSSGNSLYNATGVGSDLTVTANDVLQLNGTSIDANASAGVTVDAGTTMALASVGNTTITTSGAGSDLTMSVNDVLTVGSASMDYNATGAITMDGSDVDISGVATFNADAAAVTINTTVNGTTTIGNTVGGGQVTVNVVDGASNLVLNGITEVAPGATDDILWITNQAANQTRRTAFSTLVDEGLQYQNSRFRLGSSAVDINPIISSRIVTVGAAGTLSFNTAASANQMLVLNNNGNVGISTTGAGTTTIGSATAGAISSQSASTINATAGSSMTNTTTTTLTNTVGTNYLTTAGGTITQTSTGNSLYNTTAAGSDLTITAIDVLQANATTVDVNASGAVTVDAGTSIANTSGTTTTNTVGTNLLTTAGGTITQTSTGNSLYNTTAAGSDLTVTAIDVLQLNGTTIDGNASAALTLDAGTTMDLTSVGNATLSATGVGSDLTIGVNDVTTLNTTTLDVNASGAITVDAALTMALASVGNASLSVTGAGSDLTIGVNDLTTLNTTTLDVNASGAITVDAALTTDITSVGSATLSATGVGSDLTIGVNDLTTLNTTTLDVNASGAITVDAALTTALTSVGNTSVSATAAGSDISITANDDLSATATDIIVTGSATTTVNTTGTGTTTIGHLAGGAITAQGNGTNGLRLLGNGVASGDNTIVIDPGQVAAAPATGDEYDLILNNIRTVAPIEDLLWINGLNEVRRASFTATANEGVQFETSAFRLGASAIDVNPVVSSRFVTIGALGTLRFSSAAQANDMLVLNNDGSIGISTLGTGTTSIGSGTAGTITLNAGGAGNDVTINAADDFSATSNDVILLSTATTTINASGTATTSIGSATAGTITLNAGGAGNDVSVIAADDFSVTATDVIINGSTTTGINTTGNGPTTVGSIANTGAVAIRSNAAGSAITLDVVNSAANNLVLSNIAATVVPINMLSIDGSGNVRQTPITGTADEGLMWDAVSGDYKLGHTTDGSNPLLVARYVRINGGSLTFNTAANTMLNFTSGGDVNMQTVGTGTTTIGNAVGTFQLVSNQLNISTAGVITDALSAVEINDDLITTATTVFGDGTGVDNSTFHLGATGVITVNNGAPSDLVINESTISRNNADIAINPGAAQQVTTNGSLLVGVNAVVTNNLTVQNGNAVVTSGNLTVTSGNFNVQNAGSNNTIEGTLNANGNTAIGNSATDAITVRGVVNINDNNGGATTNIGTSGTTGAVVIGGTTNTTTMGSITTFNRGVNVNVETFTGVGPFNLDNDNYVAICTNAATQTLNLPNPATAAGRLIVVKVAGAGQINVQATGGLLVEGVVSYPVAGGGNLSRTFVSDGVSWFVIGN
ncbi:MAG TPA: hypothetical protein VK147_01080 [Candidatus Didemnitutus sp.]|nr:hypothetical protein [Candidatus Didemnitutus sp.]